MLLNGCENSIRNPLSNSINRSVEIVLKPISIGLHASQASKT